MIKKRLLLADADSEALEDFRQALGEAWEVTAVANGTAALAELETKPCDVVVADLDLAEIDGTDLLNRVQSNYPRIVRFVLAREGDRERMVKLVLGAHQFLGKPLERASLKAAIDRACALEDWIPRNSVRELVARIRTLPTIPTLYLKVQALLKSSDVTTKEVGEVIAKDMAMMTKLLQVLNSASFALPRKITDPTEAVGILGFETIGSMVMTIKLLSQYDKVKPVYFSIDRLWRHSTDVARNAKLITRSFSDDHALAEAAFTAGLMHDLGKVVLASNFDEQYRGVQSLARKQQIPLADVEREIFGASHGEIGAYLLGLWGMPLEVLEAAALHHNPRVSTNKEFTALTAVHVANALEYELRPDADGMVVSKVDEDYLGEIGMLKHLPEWRAMVTKGMQSNPGVLKISPNKAIAPAPAAPKAPAPVSVKAALVPEKQPTIGFTAVLKTPWPYVAVGVTLLIFLVMWFGSGSMVQTLVTARATPDQTVKPQPTNIIRSQVAATIPSDSAPLANPTPLTNSASVPPVKATVKAPTGLNVAGGKPVRELELADAKLQGIFYSAQNPSAIINGKMVQANDYVQGIHVLEIKNSTVTLEYKDQKRVLSLK